MSNTKFFNDAIAEAKAIRETALANAKLALELNLLRDCAERPEP